MELLVWSAPVIWVDLAGFEGAKLRSKQDDVVCYVFLSAGLVWPGHSYFRWEFQQDRWIVLCFTPIFVGTTVVLLCHIPGVGSVIFHPISGKRSTLHFYCNILCSLFLMGKFDDLARKPQSHVTLESINALCFPFWGGHWWYLCLHGLIQCHNLSKNANAVYTNINVMISFNYCM